jgi:hypothetical protein
MLTSCVWIKKAVHVHGHDYVQVHVHVKVCGLCYRVGLAAKLNEMECDVIIDAWASLLLIDRGRGRGHGRGRGRHSIWPGCKTQC